MSFIHKKHYILAAIPCYRVETFQISWIPIEERTLKVSIRNLNTTMYRTKANLEKEMSWDDPEKYANLLDNPVKEYADFLHWTRLTSGYIYQRVIFLHQE